MTNRIILKEAININAKPVKELTYDVTKITTEMFCRADALKSAAGSSASFSVYETDTSLHLYLGMMAIIAENPHIDVKDLERVKGVDILSFVVIGRNFILAGVQNSNPQTSADTSENTPEPSTPQLEN